jgi:hypothetical protein
MLRTVLCALIVCIVAASSATFADDKKPAGASANTLSVADKFSVTAPEGYAWEKSGGEAGKPLVCVATKAGDTARLVIILEPQKADSDAKRIARLKGLYNGMIQSLPQTGITPTKATPPAMSPPIPDRVQFSIVAKTKENIPVAVRGLMIFGKNTYHIQIAAPSDEAADALAKATESLKER